MPPPTPQDEAPSGVCTAPCAGEARDGKEVKLRTREDEQGGSGAATGSVPSELEFGQVVPAGEAGQEGVWRGGSGGATAVSSAARTLAVSGAGPAPERGEEAAREERAGGTAQPCVPRYTLPPSALTRLTDGEAVPGSKGARGRLDFVLQVGARAWGRNGSGVAALWCQLACCGTLLESACRWKMMSMCSM